MSDFLVSRATKEKLEEELKKMKTVGRKAIAKALEEARAHGDLKENAEYDAAKEAQQHLELRIAKLEQTLARARIIESKELPNDKIYILSKIKLQDLKTREIVDYILVSPEEADFEKNKISVTSPLGKGLMGRTMGEKVKISVPAGTLEYKILDITR